MKNRCSNVYVLSIYLSNLETAHLPLSGVQLKHKNQQEEVKTRIKYLKLKKGRGFFLALIHLIIHSYTYMYSIRSHECLDFPVNNITPFKILWAFYMVPHLRMTNIRKCVAQIHVIFVFKSYIMQQ